VRFIHPSTQNRYEPFIFKKDAAGYSLVGVPGWIEVKGEKRSRTARSASENNGSILRRNVEIIHCCKFVV